MQSNISYKSKPTLNKNKIIIIKNSQNLLEVLERFINIDSQYKKMLNDIEYKIKRKEVDHIDMVINMPPIGNTITKIFVVNDNATEDDVRSIGFKIHNYTISNGIHDFDMITKLNGEELYHIIEGILILNYKFTEYVKNNGGSPYVKYNIDLLGRSQKDQILMKKHINILENIINSVGKRLEKETKTNKNS